MDAEVSDIAENLSEASEEADMAVAARRTDRDRRTLTYVPTDHEPVLAEELVDVLDPRPGETFVDCTFGGGGHARADRRAARARGRADRRRPRPDRRGALERLRGRGTVPRPASSRADFVAALEGLRGEGMRPDGIVFDLGMSSMQVDAWERGFSYSYDAPLDMRMDPDQSSPPPTSSTSGRRSGWRGSCASFGEERRAGSIAREIVRRRPLETTSELVAAIKAAIPPAERFGRGHPAKRTFQAIRIAVNGELEALDARCRWPGTCCRSAGASARSPSTRSRTGG